MILNIGASRADELVGVETIEVPAGAVMRDVVQSVLCVLFLFVLPALAVPRRLCLRCSRGSEAHINPVVSKLLDSGVVKPPPLDEEDVLPRPTGL